MKVVLQGGQSYVLRFDRGEEVVAGLISFSQAEGMGAAEFTAIGAAGEVVLSYYNLEAKAYEDYTLKEDMEITSVVGNVAVLGMDSGSPTSDQGVGVVESGVINPRVVVHAHGTFGRKDLSVIGGHIKSLVVSATCEVHLTKLEGVLRRKFDETTGLNLLQ